MTAVEPVPSSRGLRLWIWGVVAVVVGAVGGVMLRDGGRLPVEPPRLARTSGETLWSVPEQCRGSLNDPVEERMTDAFTFASANVVTMSGRSRADRLSVRDAVVVDVGGPTRLAREIDLEGATVLPGFIDSHSHWIGDRALAGDSASQAIDSALEAGWTSISELFVNELRLNELCSLQQDGDLRLKVGAFLPINYGFERFGRWYEHFEPGRVLGPHLFLQGIKIFADRAPDGLGYQTDPPDLAVQGVLFWERDDLTAEIRHAHEAGWQIGVHATGDGGLDVVLDAFEPLGREEIVAARHRIEHATIVRDDQVARMADLGLIASIQHPWFHSDAAAELVRWVGRDRVSFTGRWRDLREAGIPLTGSTDHPHAIAGEAGPAIDALAQAVTRVGPSGDPPPRWMAAQRLTIWEVLRSLTIDAAFAQGTEDSVGSIEPGKAADLVVLSGDPTRVRADRLYGIEVLATIVDGRVEFCARSVPRDLRPLCPAATS